MKRYLLLEIGIAVSLLVSVLGSPADAAVSHAPASLTANHAHAATNPLSNIPSPTPSSCNILGFDPLARYSVDSGPQAVIIADYNNDGTLDLATTNQYSNTISILLGTGDGSFGAPVSFNAGISPIAGVAGDFNADGKLDLAISNLNSQSLSVLLGNGNGSFGAPVSYHAGIYPTTVAMGDFNHDGKLDLTVTNSDDTISVLLGNGNGTFGPAVNYQIPVGGTTAVAVGDFNADGKQDLVVTSVGAQVVSILLGVGDGTFAPAVNYSAHSQPSAVAVSDFNNDGKQDLAVVNSNSNDVSILLGNGDGTFGAPINYVVGSYPFSVVVGDFDIDGKLDLAVANRSGGSVSFLLGAGNGTFGAAHNYSVGGIPSSVSAADFNSDGRLDLAIADSQGYDAAIMLNDTSCNTATPTATATPTPTATPPNGCTDVYEPDNDYTQAKPIGIGSQHHIFCRSLGQPNDDHDWVAFAGYGGQTFDMGTLNLGISVDTVITLYSEGLTIVAHDDDGGGGRASHIRYQLPSGGIYYLEAVNKSGLGGLEPDYAYYIYLNYGTTPTPTDTPTRSVTPTHTPITPSTTPCLASPSCLQPSDTPTATASPTPTCPPGIWCGPLNPTLQVGTVTTSTVALSASANMDIGTFYFYRSTDGSHFSLIGTVQGHYGDFTDTGLDCGTSYYYYAHIQEYGGLQRQGDTNTVTPITAACVTPTFTRTPATTTPTPTDCPNPFVDVSGNFFYQAIHYLNCRGIVNGTDATHYSPAGTSTRAQFAKVVVLGFGTPFYTPGTPDFSDVPATYYAYLYIESGFHAGILSGFDANTCTTNGQIPPCYLPGRAITRGQLTKLVVNAAQYPLYTPTTPDFSDVPPTNVFYASIETAYHNSVVGGYPDHTFRPINDIRRDEMAQIVYEGIIHMP